MSHLQQWHLTFADHCWKCADQPVEYLVGFADGWIDRRFDINISRKAEYVTVFDLDQLEVATLFSKLNSRTFQSPH